MGTRSLNVTFDEKDFAKLKKKKNKKGWTWRQVIYLGVNA